MRRRNGYEVVTATVSSSAVSRRLSRLAPRSTKVGLGQPFKASPRTTGFRVTQVSRWEVRVWWRARADADPADAEAVYAGITEDLTDTGFDVAHQADELRVTQLREPNPAEWSALEAVAPHPVDCDRHAATPQIAAADAYTLIHSGLLTLIRYPLVRNDPWEPAEAHLLALAGPGRALLETRLRHERQNAPDTHTNEQETP